MKVTKDREFGFDWRAEERCLRRAVCGGNRWARSGTEMDKCERGPARAAAARLVADGAFDLAVLPLHGDACEYAPALEWISLEASLRWYGRLPPLNELHAMLNTNGRLAERVRWRLPEWRDRLDRSATAALRIVRPVETPQRL